ncbi:MAG: response regulator transcription factor [Actinomycetia bacterium]|nr:response regulator transcription factor [Actinomycetes bacterium]
MSIEPVRIAIVEDHELLLDALLDALEQNSWIEVVASFRSVSDFEAAVDGLNVDVVVTDLELGDGSGTHVVRLARQRAGAEALLMTGQGDDRGVSAALECGAAGFMSKTASLGQLIAAIRTVGDGSAVYPAPLLQQQLAGSDPTSIAVPLTEREDVVLQCLARGLNASQIGAALNISVHTSRNHIRSILTKLQAQSQLEALVIAVRGGLVEIT